MRRVGWLLLLPVIWLPLIALAIAVVPQLPWFAWVIAVFVWFTLWRRRRAAASGATVVDDPGAPAWSPFRGGGGF